VSIVVTFYMTSIGEAWKWMLSIGAGTGAVLLLRWYWWRINAWSEISAMIAALFVSVILQAGLKWNADDPLDFAWIMIVTVAVTTAVWVLVTFLTPPESTATLVAFYRRTRPSLGGWRPIAKLAPEVKPSRDGLANLVDWISGCALIYCVLFGIGKLLLKEYAASAMLLAVAIVAGAVIYRDLSRRGWSVVGD
jgi:Na+/proline symporter